MAKGAGRQAGAASPEIVLSLLLRSSLDEASLMGSNQRPAHTGQHGRVMRVGHFSHSTNSTYLTSRRSGWILVDGTVGLSVPDRAFARCRRGEHWVSKRAALRVRLAAVHLVVLARTRTPDSPMRLVSDGRRPHLPSDYRDQKSDNWCIGIGIRRWRSPAHREWHGTALRACAPLGGTTSTGSIGMGEESSRGGLSLATRSVCQ